MKMFVSGLLFLCVLASTAQGGGEAMIANHSSLKSAVARVFAYETVAERLAWKRGGVLIDTIIALLRGFEPEAYQVWLDSSKDSSQRKSLLDDTIRSEMQDKVFSLHGPFKSEYSEHAKDWEVVESIKYFWGKAEPDVKTILAEIISAPETLAKTEWKGGGLIEEDILDTLKMRHNDVYNLYVEAHAKRSDVWLRNLTRAVMWSTEGGKKASLMMQLLGDYFTLPATVHYRDVNKIFKGREPDLVESLIMAVSAAGLVDKMADSGLAMSEITDVFSRHAPQVYSLYTRTHNGLSGALKKEIEHSYEVARRQYSQGPDRYFLR